MSIVKLTRAAVIGAILGAVGGVVAAVITAITAILLLEIVNLLVGGG